MGQMNVARYVMINKEGYKINLKEKVSGTNDALVYILENTSDTELKETLINIINNYAKIFIENDDSHGKIANLNLINMPYEICIRIQAIAQKMQDELNKDRGQVKYTIANIFLDKLKKF